MLEINNLTAGYPNKDVIEVAKLTVQKGEIIAVMGQSGCGKSTMLNAIAGLGDCVQGEVSIDGNHDLNFKQLHVSLTLQNFPLLHWRTVKQNLELAAKVKKSKSVDFNQVLSLFNATHLADSYPNQISGGERCRASIAQALVTQPLLLLMDEPFVGLDTLNKRSIGHNLQAFVHAHNIAVLIVTHDIHDALEFADKVLVFGRNPDTNIATLTNIINTKDDDAEELIINTLEANYYE